MLYSVLIITRQILFITKRYQFLKFSPFQCYRIYRLAFLTLGIKVSYIPTVLVPSRGHVESPAVSSINFEF